MATRKNNKIGEVIKSNMEYFNYSAKDISELTGYSEKHFSEIINGKQNMSYDVSVKLDNLFGLEEGSLIKFSNKYETLKLAKEDEMYTKIATEISAWDKFKLFELRTILDGVYKVFGTDHETYVSNISKRGVKFNRYREKPLSSLWFAIMERKYGYLKSKGKFHKSNANSVLNKTLNIMLDTTITFDERYERTVKMLDGFGVVLQRGPFLANSTMTGASTKVSSFEELADDGTFVKRNTQRFIFLNDYQKKEYSFIFSLIHELFHTYDLMDGENNAEIVSFIRKFMDNNNKYHDELVMAFDVMGDETKTTREKADILYKNTNKPVNFGDAQEFLRNELGI